MRRRALLERVAAGGALGGLAGLVGCSDLDLSSFGSTPAPTPTPAESTPGTPAEAASEGELGTIEIANAVPSETYLTVAVETPDDRDVFVENLVLEGRSSRRIDDVLPGPGEYRVVAETGDGDRVERGWIAGRSGRLDRVAFFREEDRFAGGQRAACRPTCPPISVEGDVPVSDRGPVDRSVRVQVRNFDRDLESFALTARRAGTTLLDYEYRPPFGGALDIEVPVSVESDHGDTLTSEEPPATDPATTAERSSRGTPTPIEKSERSTPAPTPDLTPTSGPGSQTESGRETATPVETVESSTASPRSRDPGAPPYATVRLEAGGHVRTDRIYPNARNGHYELSSGGIAVRCPAEPSLELRRIANGDDRPRELRVAVLADDERLVERTFDVVAHDAREVLVAPNVSGRPGAVRVVADLADGARDERAFGLCPSAIAAVEIESGRPVVRASRPTRPAETPED